MAVHHRPCGPDWLDAKIAAGRPIIIDGAMGTELEARGVPMNATAWSGAAVLSHPDVVRAVHADYIDAGAEVIITNTFAAGRQALESAGLGEQFSRVNAEAVRAARIARDGSGSSPVAIAGSMCPWVDSGAGRSEKRLAAEYREQADILAAEGVDLLALEMCTHPVYTPLMIEAAVATGLPVWLGLSCRRMGDSADLVSFDPPHVDFRELVIDVVDRGASVINIMHTTVDDTPPGLAVLEDLWQGPVGVYPESGYFVMPSWQFVDIIGTDELVACARVWVDGGVRILGGCCGLGVAHVRALSDAFA